MKLKLGRMPDSTVIKVTIAMPAPVKAQLDRYAELYSRVFGETSDAQTLIPLMLEAFLAKDRAFQRALKQKIDH